MTKPDPTKLTRREGAPSWTSFTGAEAASHMLEDLDDPPSYSAVRALLHCSKSEDTPSTCRTGWHTSTPRQPRAPTRKGRRSPTWSGRSSPARSSRQWQPWSILRSRSSRARSSIGWQNTSLAQRKRDAEMIHELLFSGAVRAAVVLAGGLGACALLSRSAAATRRRPRPDARRLIVPVAASVGPRWTVDAPRGCRSSPTSRRARRHPERTVPQRAFEAASGAAAPASPRGGLRASAKT